MPKRNSSKNKTQNINKKTNVKKTAKAHYNYSNNNVRYVAIQKGLITIIMKFPKKSLRKTQTQTKDNHLVRGGVSKEANMLLEMVRSSSVNDDNPKRTEVSREAEKYAKMIGTENIVKTYMDKGMDAQQKYGVIMSLVSSADDKTKSSSDAEKTISDQLDILVQTGKITPAKKQSILDTMSSKGIVSSVSKSAVNALTRSASAVGNWLTPPTTNIQWPPNKTTVRMLYYPAVHKMGSLSSDNDANNNKNPPFGEVVLMVDDAYANTYEMFRKKFGSVDDMFKNLIEGVSRNPKNPVPRNQQIITIEDIEPTKSNSGSQSSTSQVVGAAPVSAPASNVVASTNISAPVPAAPVVSASNSNIIDSAPGGGKQVDSTTQQNIFNIAQGNLPPPPPYNRNIKVGTAAAAKNMAKK